MWNFALLITLLAQAPSLAEIGRPIADPCSGEIGRTGFSQAWTNSVLIERGHPFERVCGPDAELDDLRVQGLEAVRREIRFVRARRDLAAQAAGRAYVQIGRDSLGIPFDAPWSEEEEAAALAHAARMIANADAR